MYSDIAVSVVKCLSCVN